MPPYHRAHFRKKQYTLGAARRIAQLITQQQITCHSKRRDMIHYKCPICSWYHVGQQLLSARTI